VADWQGTPVTDHLDHPWRARHGASARDRIRRITSGLEHEADALAKGVLVPKHRRLAPLEHWQPQLDEPRAEELPEPAPPAVAGRPPVMREVAPVAPEQAPAPTVAPPERRAPLLPEAPTAPAWLARLRRVARDRRWTASWLDRLLVAIEVTATLGLVAAALTSFGMVDRLQQDLARLSNPSPMVPAPATAPAPSATPLPTPSPSPVPTWAELPGSRNAPTPAATPSAEPPSLVGARLVIPAIRVDAPIVEGDDWETLKDGVGHHIGSGLPGEAGNMVLSAHVDVYGAIFRDLGELREGDLVLVDTPRRTYRYKVTSVRIVAPQETSVMDATADPTLTLITCYPPLVDTHRMVVSASFVR